jgi:HK97 gp10 family phage protein
MEGLLSAFRRRAGMGKIFDDDERGCETVIKLETKGFQELIDTLDDMDEEGIKVFKQALNDGAAVVLPVMRRKVYEVLRKRSGDLQKNIKKGTVRKLKNGGYSQIIGISKGDVSVAYYGKFSEYGTVHEPARPWIRPAFDESKEEAYQKIESTLVSGIKQSFMK